MTKRYDLIPFNLEDAEEVRTICNFYKQHQDGLFIKWEDSELEDIALEGISYYGLYRGNKDLIGVTSLEEVTPRLATIWSSLLKEEYRGKGLGSLMTELLEEIALGEGYTKLSTHVYVENLPNIILKLKRGYLIEGLLRDHDEIGQDEYIMGKVLI